MDNCLKVVVVVVGIMLFVYGCCENIWGGSLWFERVVFEVDCKVGNEKYLVDLDVVIVIIVWLFLDRLRVGVGDCDISVGFFLKWFCLIWFVFLFLDLFLLFLVL